MIRTRIETFLSKRRCTLLCVGPVSKNCVDATIELANDCEVPIVLIASRRQIEASAMGGGYANNWSTEDFAKYVINRDKKGQVILARDHGGPWQNQAEKDDLLSLRQAMTSAKKSYQVDIESGFEIVHIDPSIDIFGHPSIDEILMRLFELYEYCWSVASRNHREIAFEIGTEEQNISSSSLSSVEYFLAETVNFCRKNAFPNPCFVVAQTGTKVFETRNVGSFASPFRIVRDLPSEILVPRIVSLCNKYQVFLKQHNSDYLSDEILSWHPKFGIHSVNVAPEFGIVESRAFVSLMKSHNLESYEEEFIQAAYDSRRWEKWMLPETKASDTEKAIIAGHYIFATPRFIEIKKAVQAELEHEGIDVDTYLTEEVKHAILRYLRCFRLVR